MKIDVRYHKETAYTGVGLDRFYCICIHIYNTGKVMVLITLATYTASQFINIILSSSTLYI